MLPIKFLAEVDNKLKDKALQDKIKTTKPVKIKTNNIVDLIEKIRQDLSKNLGHYEHEYQLIQTVEHLEDYIEKANKFGKIAIDTETMGLNPMTDKIVGICLYFTGEKGAYIPINHVDYLSGELLPNQLTAEQIRGVLAKLTAKIIMHNAQFDIRVIKHSIGIVLKCWWDTQTGATLLNENELHGLKYLHGKYISKTKELTFKDFFGNILFTDIPIEYAYLYAIHDAVDTFNLQEFQEKYLNENSRPDFAAIYWLMMNIEMPMVNVIVDLQDIGVAIDFEHLDKISKKYHAALDDALERCYAEIDKYKDKIDMYNAENPTKALSYRLNIGSSTQLAILLYDVLGVKQKGKSRSTDKAMLDSIADKYPIVQAIIDYRGAQKITSTYIDNIYNIVHTDNRVHTHFKSNGAKTGRLSSSNPINLQNIPSHIDDIRQMFVGQTSHTEIDTSDIESYTFDRCEEIETIDGWKFIEELKIGDKLIDGEIIRSVDINDLEVTISFDK